MFRAIASLLSASPRPRGRVAAPGRGRDLGRLPQRHQGGHVTEQVGVRALEAAAGGPIEEGPVGGGTGMCCDQFKGGSGTASRVIDCAAVAFTLGVLVQANFGPRRELTVADVPMGEAFGDDNPMEAHFAMPPGTGSVIAIMATDAPLLPGQCKALAHRVPLSLARTGTSGSHFSS